MTEMYAASDVPPTLAYVAIMIAIGALLPAVIVCLLRARARYSLAKAAASADTSPMLVEGTDVVLCGVVRHLEGESVAVKVSITQEGSESESSGVWSHSWTEVRRDVMVAPFLLELPNGEHVRIDPPPNVDVADALDQKVWLHHTRRVCSAELVPGEKIFVRGRLERSDVAKPEDAYRDVAWGWALVPVGGQMLLSSEPLGAGMRKRGRFHAHYGVVALLLLATTQLMLFSFYQRVAGETVGVTVTKKTYYTTTDDDGNITGHDGIDFVVASEGWSRHAEIDDVNAPTTMEGETVAVRRATQDNWNLGPRATLGWFTTILLVLMPWPFWIVYLLRRRASRPWFRRALDEKGSGPLPSKA